MTAVEWLVEQIFFSDQREKFEKYIKQALEMEKQQIINAFDNFGLYTYRNGEQYYNDTYKKP